MTAFLVRRLIQSAIVLFGVSTVLFFLIRLSGDPVDLLAGINAPQEVKTAIRQSLGLEDPLALQYVRFLGDMARLDFGRSITSRRPALEEVLEVLPNTLLLAVSAMIVGLVIALPLGVFAALNRRNFGGFLVMAIAVLGQSVPSFFLAVLLILFFSVQLRLLPSFGTGTLQHMVLPVLTLSSVIIARYARLIRSGMLDVLGQDYIRTARAKGLRENAVLISHALRNTLIPITTVLGLDLSALVGGAVIIETVFVWPGMGQQLVQSVASRDYPVVQATVFVVALLVVVIAFVVDLAYSAIDPRIRLE